MSAGWRTVRVFISSTFRDMHAERDHLVRFVFPRLREALARRRLHLVDVDLRWGVTADQDALELCLDEIDRCRPLFLCMLGGRYGWVPPGSTKSITAAEIAYGALEHPETTGRCSFYFRDPAATRSVPPDQTADYREPEGSAAEASLAALERDVRRAAASRGPRALRVRDYSCSWDAEAGRFTGLEAFGETVYRDLLADVEAEFGAVSGATAAAAPVPPDEFADERAAMEAFAETRIERYVVGSRRSVFEHLASHAERQDRDNWLVLVGEPGSGKSALLARLWRDAVEGIGQCRPRPGLVVIAHFAGASAASVSVRHILRRLCHEVDAGIGPGAGFPPPPDTIDGLREALDGRLMALGSSRPVLLLLDAINQIDAGEAGHGLGWLPESLPPLVRVVCSVVPGPALDALRARRARPEEISLGPIDSADATAIVAGFLERYRKALDPKQRASLLAKADAGRPLYLLTALEELRTLGGYEEMTRRIDELPGETGALFEWILARLESDPGFRDSSGRPAGRLLVPRFGAMLAAGRAGMTEPELKDLAAPGEDGGPSDALGNVAAILRLLRPYLMRRGPLLDFFHGQLREAVDARYLSDPTARAKTHRTIGEYFRRLGDPAGDRTWNGAHVRALSELPYHLTEAGRWDEVYATLTDLAFLEAKCSLVGAATTGARSEARTVYNGVYELQDDFRRALEKMPRDESAGVPAGTDS